MALTDARVKFLRGTLANMPTDKTDGNIYITTDERGMYIDYNDGTELKRIRIGDLLEFERWSDISAQSPTGTYSTSALYYAKQENILGKWDGTSWTQINAPTTFSQIISDMGYNVTVGSGTTATIKLDVKNASNISQFADKLTYKIQSADNSVLRLSSSTDGQSPAHTVINMRVKDLTDHAELGTADSTYNTNEAVINIFNYATGTDSSGTTVSKPANLAAASTIKIKGDGLVYAQANATTGVITLKSDLVFAQSFDASGNLNTTVTNGVSNLPVANLSVTPTLTYGKSGAKTNAKFISGVADLDVYTTAQTDSEIEKALKANNAMVFKGSLGTVAAGGIVQTLPLDDDQVKIGDTYKVVTPNNYVADNKTPATTYTAIIGDMFIATSSDGTEEADGYIAKSKIRWVYIPSGNDDQTAYTIEYNSTNKKFILSGGNSVQIGAGWAIGTGLDVASTGSANNQLVTISHHAYSAVTPAADTTTDVAVGTTNNNRYTSQTFTAITGLTLDNGHITGIKTGQFTVQLNKIQGVAMAGGLVTSTGAAITASASATSSRANITTTITHADGTNSKGDVKLSSNTLTFTQASASADLTVDMLWESF